MSAGNEQNAAALQEFWNSVAPMSQVRENLNPPNGTYNLVIAKLEPAMDDNGLLYLFGTFQITAPAEVAALPNASHRERFYIGSKNDPSATQPSTRLNAPGFSRLKGIARVCDVPANDQTVGALCSALLNKAFTCRIETVPDKKDPSGQRTFCNLGRTPVKLGTLPAKLDAPVAGVGTNGNAAPAASAVPAGAQFSAE